jgi:hypothetical protein
MNKTAEYLRLETYHHKLNNWKNWGPYLSERAWGTVREDYSAEGNPWDYFPHDHARSRAYRWNEDGLAGISDRKQYLCFAISMWNGKDPILKERLFGLNGTEGNHGEDVKEYYFYLDNTPTHSYMKYLYKYPQAEFPYFDLISKNHQRGYYDLEYELLKSSVFNENRYFDVIIEYAKAAENDILIQISVTNLGPQEASLYLLPTIWYRNTWSWGYPAGPMGDVDGKPQLRQFDFEKNTLALQADHPAQERYYLYAEGAADLFFTENETNTERLYGIANDNPYKKDSFHRYLIGREMGVLNPAKIGTKAAAYFPISIGAGETKIARLRLSNVLHAHPFSKFDSVVSIRRTEADDFFAEVQASGTTDEEKQIQRQALSGMLWNKQLYYYDVDQWLEKDPGSPPPLKARKEGRNHEWAHLNNFDIISMPDKWEYPWYGAWDLAFHSIPLTLVDPDFAKRQLVLMTREWYMHPNGQLPAYEWAFGDVNPPVHAWAAWHVYQIDAEQHGKPDRSFLEGVFHKLLLNFTWWTNQKDKDGNNIFQGGFLGLDNISVFNRSAVLPTGGHIDQSDGTAWMGFYSLGMLKISLELSKDNPIYQDLATKFYEHFLGIAHAMTNCGDQGICLWNEEDSFFYDALHMGDGNILPLKVRSLVGLIPLLAVEIIEPDILKKLPDFDRRMHWFTQQRPALSGNMASIDVEGVGQRHIVSILTRERLVSVLQRMLDPNEFLSDFGIRSVSKYHQLHPFEFTYGDKIFSINYQPAESQDGLFGGNSNWRGPVWFPINYLIIESLQKFYQYYGDDLLVECPTGSGQLMNLKEVAEDLSRRLIRLFLKNENGKRPIYGAIQIFQEDPNWDNNLLFYEYFNGDNGAGLGASHQTGWTGLVANLIQQLAKSAA